MVLLSYANPPYNMLTFDAVAELEKRLEVIAADSAVHVVVLASRVDGYFAAHADLDDLAMLIDGPVPKARSWHTVMSLLVSMPQPVVAAVDGIAGGGGFELALACTLRWAGEHATFRLPETSLGIIPGSGGTQRLVRLVGSGPAAELVLTGEDVPADVALRLGVVGRVLPHEGFLDDVLAAAHELAGKPRPALAAAKRLVLRVSELPLREGLKEEGKAFSELLVTPESVHLREERLRRYAAERDG